MKVLIVDDEEAIRESLHDFFTDEGFTVSTAENGAIALDELRRAELPSVVILDLVMPVLSGAALYAEMQKDPRLARLPVIVSTSDPSGAPRGLPVMRKPMDLDRLLGAVRDLMT